MIYFNMFESHTIYVLLLFVRGDGRSNLTGYYYNIVQFTLFIQILLHRKHQQ